MKLVSFDTATSPVAAFEIQSVLPAVVTTVFESISNGVTPLSAACAGEAGEAASVIATGAARAAAKYMPAKTRQGIAKATRPARGSGEGGS